jgi:hypothetical protein
VFHNEITSNILIDMLKENTGSHFLDSGGYYGRNWQRNQEVDFKSMPESTLEFAVWGKENNIEVSITHDLYHWLMERLIFDPEMDSKLQSIIDNSEAYYSEDIEEFIDQLKEDHDVVISGSDNSYNYDNLLSQTIQWTEVGIDDITYCILEIHGGCDVRGGYTRPRVFELDEMGMWGMYDANISCPQCRATWYTDDAYHMYYDGSSKESEYDFKSMFPIEIDKEAGKSLKEKFIYKFGAQKYNKIIDKIDNLKVLKYRILNSPRMTVQRIVNWAGKTNHDKSKATLKLYAYSKPINGSRVRHYWQWSIMHPKIFNLIKKIELPLIEKPELCKRPLIIYSNGDACCPVCNRGTLYSRF